MKGSYLRSKSTKAEIRAYHDELNMLDCLPKKMRDQYHQQKQNDEYSKMMEGNYYLDYKKVKQQRKEKCMRRRYNIQSVQVVISDKMFIIKAVKYLMLATMTFCLVYIALWFQHYEAMVM